MNIVITADVPKREECGCVIRVFNLKKAGLEEKFDPF